MTPTDIWAATAESLACATISIRGFMLRPHQQVWTGAPTPVWVSLTALGIGEGMAAAPLWFGAHASGREAMTATLMAICGAVMLWNLNRHGRSEEVRRRECAKEAQLAMDLSGPPARCFGERSAGVE